MENFTQTNLNEAKWEVIPMGGDATPFIIKKRQLLVGRSESCDIIIKDTVTSSIHASIVLSGDAVRIVDLGSTNGTFIEKKKIESVTLDKDTTVTFGKTSYRFKKLGLAELADAVEKTANIYLPDLEEQTKREIDLSQLGFDGEEGPVQVEKEKTFVGKILPKIAKKKAPPPPDEFVEASLENLDDAQRQEAEKRELQIRKRPDLKSPLEINPQLVYSEFIFEESEELFPIFNYDLSQKSIEVIIIAKEIVLFVNYLPIKSGSYQIVGHPPKEYQVHLDSLSRKEKKKFIKIKGNGEVYVHQLPEFKTLHISTEGNPVVKDNKPLLLGENDVIQFHQGSKRIIIRSVGAPPDIIPPPFLGRDRTVFKFFIPMVILGLLLLTVLQFVKVNREKLVEKAPEKITKILYRPPKHKIKQLKELAKQQQKRNEKRKQAKKAKQSPSKKITQKRTKPVKTKRKKAPQKQKMVTHHKGKQQPKVKKFVPKFNFNKSIKSIVSKSGAIKNINFGKLSGPSKLKTTAVGSLKVGRNQMTEVKGKIKGLIKSGAGIDQSIRASGIGTKKGISLSGVSKKTVILGSMDPELVRNILRKYLRQFSFCYDEELERKGAQGRKRAKGSSILDFIIGPSGRVKSGKLVTKGWTMSSTGQKCIINILKGIKFPKPKGGGTVQIRQPLNFDT